MITKKDLDFINTFNPELRLVFYDSIFNQKTIPNFAKYTNDSEVVALYIKLISEVNNFKSKKLKSENREDVKERQVTFKQSPFFNNQSLFITKFQETDTFKEYRLNIDVIKLYNEIVLTTQVKEYKYINWIAAAVKWFLNNPNKYILNNNGNNNGNKQILNSANDTKRFLQDNMP